MPTGGQRAHGPTGSSQSFPFDDDRLARVIAATFKRRETEVPVNLPDALTPAFAEDEQKQRQ